MLGFNKGFGWLNTGGGGGGSVPFADSLLQRLVDYQNDTLIDALTITQTPEVCDIPCAILNGDQQYIRIPEAIFGDIKSANVDIEFPLPYDRSGSGLGLGYRLDVFGGYDTPNATIGDNLKIYSNPAGEELFVVTRCSSNVVTGTTVQNFSQHDALKSLFDGEMHNVEWSRTATHTSLTIDGTLIIDNEAMDGTADPLSRIDSIGYSIAGGGDFSHHLGALSHTKIVGDTTVEYTLEETSGDRTLNIDSLGNDGILSWSTGTLLGMRGTCDGVASTLHSKGYGECASFNGSNFASAPVNITTDTGDFEVSFDGYIKSDDNGFRTFINLGGGGGQMKILMAGTVLTTYTGTAFIEIETSGMVRDRFYPISLKRVSGQLTLSIGNTTSAPVALATLYAPAGNSIIGAEINLSAKLKGLIDNVKMVQEGVTIVDYEFSNMDGETIVDKSGLGNDGLFSAFEYAYLPVMNDGTVNGYTVPLIGNKIHNGSPCKLKQSDTELGMLDYITVSDGVTTKQFPRIADVGGHPSYGIDAANVVQHFGAWDCAFDGVNHNNPTDSIYPPKDLWTGGIFITFESTWVGADGSITRQSYDDLVDNLNPSNNQLIKWVRSDVTDMCWVKEISSYYQGAFENVTDGEYFQILNYIGATTCGNTWVPTNFDPNKLQSMSYHLGNIEYWDTPYFANAISIEENWRNDNNGANIDMDSGQFNSDGYPTYLDVGIPLRLMGIPMGKGWQVPANWPDRGTFTTGKIAITWDGHADIQNTSGTFNAGDSTVAETGVFEGGKRVYDLTSADTTRAVLYELGATQVSNVKCWLPNSNDPANVTLEGQDFHDALIDTLDDRAWGWIRFLDWAKINASPQQDWIDRRPADHVFETSIINTRPPADGFAGDRYTGASFETMIALCNEADKDMWVNIPHMATDDFVTKYAQLIKYGSDGVTPYTSEQTSPEFAPLKSNLKVYLEYSNEVWSNGDAFAQGNWAQDEADLQSITKQEFVAERSSNCWELFEQVMDSDRVVRVAAIWTGGEAYTVPYINEFYDNPALLEPDTMAVATYYGNGIQNWAFDNNSNIPTTAEPWIDPYWTSAQIDTDLDLMFDKWESLILAGESYGGATGYDEVGSKGGLPDYVTTLSNALDLPMVAYEGGPSLYTNHLDGGAPEDNGITLFITEANRRQRFADLYELHANQAFERGLRSNVGYVDIGVWGKYGQWGQLEYILQDTSTSPKYQEILSTFDEFNIIQSVNNPTGIVPIWNTPETLPRMEVGIAYDEDLSLTAGTGITTTTVIGDNLPSAITFDIPTLNLSGTPTTVGTTYLYLRAIDQNNDPAWRTFSLLGVERNTDPSVMMDFEAYTIGDVFANPLVIGDFEFECPDRDNSLKIHGITGDIPNGWASNVLRAGATWPSEIDLKRTDGQPFDLHSLDIGSTAGEICTITARQDGGGTTVKTITLANPATSVVENVFLDLVSILEVNITFTKTSGQVATGVIDNVAINYEPLYDVNGEKVLDVNGSWLFATRT